MKQKQIQESWSKVCNGEVLTEISAAPTFLHPLIGKPTNKAQDGKVVGVDKRYDKRYGGEHPHFKKEAAALNISVNR